MEYYGSYDGEKFYDRDLGGSLRDWRCPQCGRGLDSICGPGVPCTGDISVCVYCGVVLQIGEDRLELADSELRIEIPGWVVGLVQSTAGREPWFAQREIGDD